MKNYLSLVFIVTALLSNTALAEIYKRVDPDGRITYSNVKTKGATRLELDPDANTISNDRAKASSGSKRTATPEGFPRVDKDTQNQRDGKRKDILQSELDSEKAALDQAKKAYAEGESNPEVYKTKDGKTMRNVPKFEEKMKNLQAEVDSHQKNIELLQKEIDALK
jgi:chromosome segregation ATPase